MQIISNANENVLAILGKPRKAKDHYRMIRYCTELQTEEGILLYNLLTKELILLTEEEYRHRTGLPYLQTHWFVIPEELKEQEFADLVLWVLQTRKKKPREITSYTILTTTDCNARCFYCYELGRSRIPMSEETARKTVRYIKAHRGEKPVKLTWFGGEPLFNLPAIDTISQGLTEENIPFTSMMVSNGYLFTDEIVQKAVSRWNLKRIQITLDGTEAVYNRAKAFIYRDGNSPYRIVLDNIERLLNASVQVVIRLNMDLHNAEDLLALVDELAQRFGGRKGLRVYAHHLFQGNEQMADSRTAEEWEVRDAAMCRLNDKIRACGLAARQGIEKQYRLNHCMADSGKSVTILPTGDIGLCEHYSESEFAGHLDRDTLDPAMLASWKQTTPQIPECAECFYYPACIKLKKCPTGGVCFLQARQDQLRKTKMQMEEEYRLWKSSAQDADTETDSDEDFC